MGLDYAEMAEDQVVDPEVQSYRTAPTALRMQEVVFDAANSMRLSNVSMGEPCPLVPVAWGRSVFDTIHILSHLGVKASTKLVRAKFVWPDLCRAIRAWVPPMFGMPACQGPTSQKGYVNMDLVALSYQAFNDVS
uniref:Integrase zinc-binding domain-containing protein n=1 Tax=Knipowitschia caucasica TaxID=637954 RepID=A0AAV2IU37_KNICA